MAAFNNKTDLINVAKIQNGNAQLSLAVKQLLPDTEVWFNTHIQDNSLMIQVPCISYTLKNSKGAEVIVYFSDWHEYDGYNGLENAGGKFRIAYINNDFGFDEFEKEDFETVEELIEKLNEK